MKRISPLIALLLTLCVSNANAALIGVANGIYDKEVNELLGTLTSLGHTVTDVIDGSLDLIIGAPSMHTADFVGIPYLQISDWGQDHIANTYYGTPLAGFPQGTPVEITLTGSHAILTGLSSDWSSFGTFHYGSTIFDMSQSWVGWATDIPGLANASVGTDIFNNVLAVSGADIYIGWNVYGSEATADDLLLLSNSIEYLTTGTVTSKSSIPEPPSIILLVFGMIGLVLSRRK
ncbi:PEP-CTERM sorting domain-containing protein [Neptunicella sp. SCSIO 80796]|uniref:PEP-CTERM sorting domain-containing protein n=1 Tax=Neptunicella plasticusilytica TaxID=3117012 RepID=UPI003A4D984E